jgi:hypothetical protein
MTSLPFTRPPFLSFYKTVRSPKKFHPTPRACHASRTDLLSACGNAESNRELPIPGHAQRLQKPIPKRQKHRYNVAIFMDRNDLGLLMVA